MKYQLVLQFDGSSIEDFDKMLKLELDLSLALKGEHNVEGHEFRSRELNIFINTDNPKKAFEISKEILDNAGIEKVVAAYKSFDCEEYAVIYPEGDGKEISIQRTADSWWNLAKVNIFNDLSDIWSIFLKF